MNVPSSIQRWLFATGLPSVVFSFIRTNYLAGRIFFSLFWKETSVRVQTTKFSNLWASHLLPDANCKSGVSANFPLYVLGSSSFLFILWVCSVSFIFTLCNSFEISIQLPWRSHRPVVPRGARGAIAPQILADQLTLSQPSGAYYAHQILAPPDF